MPVSGLPTSLEDLLGTIIQTCTVKSWQIYSEKDGVSFRIRFANTENGGQAVEGNVGYVKKPPSKVARDKDRMSKRVTRSQSKQTEATEMPRYVNESPCDSNGAQRPCSHAGLVQSPMSVEDSTSCTPEPSQYDYAISPTCHTPISPKINSPMLPDPTLDYTGDQEKMDNYSDISSVDLSDQDDHQEFDTEISPDLSVPPRCNVRRCHYRDYSVPPLNYLDTFRDMVVCSKCSEDNPLTNMYICKTCNFTHHKHERHKQYLIPMVEFTARK